MIIFVDVVAHMTFRAVPHQTLSHAFHKIHLCIVRILAPTDHNLRPGHSETLQLIIPMQFFLQIKNPHMRKIKRYPNRHTLFVLTSITITIPIPFDIEP